MVVLVSLLAIDAQASARWHLDFKPGKLDRISIMTGKGRVTYWYLIYTISNNTDDAVRMALSIKATSDGREKPYLEGYYPTAEKAIEAKLGKDFLNIKEMRSEIDAGDSKEALAIFGSVTESTDTLKVQVLGLWDRVSREGAKLFVEDRALELTYYRPGDELFPQYDRIRLKAKKWKVILREERTR
jgi:hypothetical protein